MDGFLTQFLVGLFQCFECLLRSIEITHYSLILCLLIFYLSVSS